MAFANINPLAHFWQKAGLRHILFSDNLAHYAEKSISQEKKNALNVNKANKEIFSVQNKSEARSYKSAGAPPVKSINEQTSAVISENVWVPIPPEQLPLPWKNRLAKTPPGHAIWTYADLALDLEVEPKDEIMQQARLLRRNFLQNLIKDLNQPAGTHTFWPTRVLVDGKLTADADSFWSGIEHLGSRILFIFGKQAFEDSNIPKKHDPFYRKCYICQLGELDKLATMPRGHLTALTIMQGAFKLAGPRNQR